VKKTKANKQKKTYIHVNQHVIRSNLKNNATEPCITVKSGKTNTYCHEVIIKGTSTVRQSATDKPILSCGARVVMETYAEVECINYDTVNEKKKKVKYETGMISGAGIEHINPDKSEIDFS